MSLGNMWPRSVSVQGSDRYPSLLVAHSIQQTCGVVVFRSRLNNEGYLYINGTNPMQLMWGGVTQVMTAPAGGVAIGTPVTPVVGGQLVTRTFPGWCVYGSDRVSSSILVAGGPKAAPAVGLMNNAGADINYLFMTDTGALITLMLGTEADWLAGGGSAAVISTGGIAPSGMLDIRRDGRSVLADEERTIPTALVVQGTGKSAALGLVNGDYTGGIAISLDPSTKAVRESTLAAWQAWV